MLVCNRTDSLVLLLEDSTIHTANISNDYYLPVARYDHDIEKSGNTLQSIHLYLNWNQLRLTLWQYRIKATDFILRII
jgi:hypothetical protein